MLLLIHKVLLNRMFRWYGSFTVPLSVPVYLSSLYQSQLAILSFTPCFLFFFFTPSLPPSFLTWPPFSFNRLPALLKLIFNYASTLTGLQQQDKLPGLGAGRPISKQGTLLRGGTEEMKD